MPRNYWMVVQSEENFEISREMGFKLHGLASRYRRRAQRMEPDDRVLYYVSELRSWPATATITSRYFEERSRIWKYDGRREDFPYRINLSPAIVLDENDYIDALVLGPRLEYVKRWPPETWPLAFRDSLHLLPQRDFRLIEGEMKRVLAQRRRSRRRSRERPYRRDDRPEADEQQEELAPEAEHPEAEAPVAPVSSDDPQEASALEAERSETEASAAPVSSDDPQEESALEEKHPETEASAAPVSSDEPQEASALEAEHFGARASAAPVSGDEATE